MTFIKISIHIIPIGFIVKWTDSLEAHLQCIQQYSEDNRKAKEFSPFIWHSQYVNILKIILGCKQYVCTADNDANS